MSLWGWCGMHEHSRLFRSAVCTEYSLGPASKFPKLPIDVIVTDVWPHVAWFLNTWRLVPAPKIAAQPLEFFAVPCKFFTDLQNKNERAKIVTSSSIHFESKVWNQNLELIVGLRNGFT